MEAADTRSEANTYLSSFAVYCRICNPFQRWESGPRSCMLRCQSQVRAFYITRPLRGVTAGGILCVRQFALPLQKTALCQRTSSIVRYVRSCLLDDVPFNFSGQKLLYWDAQGLAAMMHAGYSKLEVLHGTILSMLQNATAEEPQNPHGDHSVQA